MKHKISELEGALLDAAVAKAEGIELWVNVATGTLQAAQADNWNDPLTYSADWRHGGPIIERERIELLVEDGGVWVSCKRDNDAGNHPITDGPTPLIAAMRAYAYSKFGETVELP